MLQVKLFASQDKTRIEKDINEFLRSIHPMQPVSVQLSSTTDSFDAVVVYETEDDQ